MRFSITFKISAYWKIPRLWLRCINTPNSSSSSSSSITTWRHAYRIAINGLHTTTRWRACGTREACASARALTLKKQAQTTWTITVNNDDDDDDRLTSSHLYSQANRIDRPSISHKRREIGSKSSSTRRHLSSYICYIVTIVTHYSFLTFT